MSESVHTSSAVARAGGPRKVGDDLGLSLLSHIEADILRYLISTSGNGSHLRLTIYPDVGKVPH